MTDWQNSYHNRLP